MVIFVGVLSCSKGRIVIRLDSEIKAAEGLCIDLEALIMLLKGSGKGVPNELLQAQSCAGVAWKRLAELQKDDNFPDFS